MEAIAPSSADVLAAKAELSGLFKNPDALWRIPKVHPNDTSVALWIEFGEVRILLGADLERKSSTDRGWKAVVSHYSENLTGKAVVVKVPHHGSITGHEDAMWTEMAGDGSHAVIAPYRPSHLPLPRDVDRIQLFTEQLHLTARANPPKPSSLPSVMRGHVTTAVEPEGRSGQVLIRGKSDTSPNDMTIRTFKPAHSLA